LTCSKIACHYMAAGRALATPCPALATDRGMGDPINDRPQRYHAHTDPSPALSGSVVALARTALALLGSRAAAAAEPAGTDPVLALWRHYNDLLRQQDPVSDSTTALRAVLAARWGKAGEATLPADILWGHDPQYAELRRLINESDRLGGLILDTGDAMADTPAASLAGLRGKIQLAISLWPTNQDYLDNCEYHEDVALAVLRDADRLLAIQGEG
jgi:hypothetical protein